MKVFLFVALVASSFAACAHDPNHPDPCIGSYEARKTMPCQCPGTLDQACYPFPADVKKPKSKADAGANGHGG